MNHMRLLHIYKDYPPVIGGIEHHLRDLAEGLAARGHEVTVLVTSRDRRTTVEQQPGLNIIRAARTLYAASTPLSLEMLRQAHALRADIVHIQFPYPPADLAALLVLDAPPLVISYQSDIVRQQNLLHLYQPLLNRTLARAARILAASPAYITSSATLRPHAAKCRVVPLGIDPARFAHANPVRVAELRARFGVGPVALFIGRLRYYKGLHVLVEALRAAPQITLVIGGTGPEYPRLIAQAQQLGVAERIHFIGDIPDSDLAALHQAADFFVLPSHLRAEAYGIAQLEALASGLPAISTELGTGTSWVNQHGETGLVVPPENPQALAAAMNTLADDPALRSRYSANARQRVAQYFTIDRMLDAVEGIYAELGSRPQL